ncbi:MAG: hypothetical protein AB7K24_24320 [Gemmataceae bacterium]
MGMVVSFDVDDTLVCDRSVPTEPSAPWLFRLWFNEPLRRGARDLMRELIRLDCKLWIYTTSFRDPLYLKLWFRSLGVRLAGVVNQTVHDRVVKPMPFRGYTPSKYPPAFGIDMHVDDSEGVGEEGRRHGFSVVVVRPDDVGWTATVLDAVHSQRGAR